MYVVPSIDRGALSTPGFAVKFSIVGCVKVRLQQLLGSYLAVDCHTIIPLLVASLIISCPMIVLDVVTRNNNGLLLAGGLVVPAFDVSTSSSPSICHLLVLRFNVPVKLLLL
jgi:hypothetical protein